jgi:hypothetical protein
MRERDEILKGALFNGVFQNNEGRKAILEVLLDIRQLLLEKA